jgi:predicted RNase H-like HicB family nuclease
MTKPRYLDLFGHDYYPHLFGGGPMPKRTLHEGEVPGILKKYMIKYPDTMNVILRNQARA